MIVGCVEGYVLIDAGCVDKAGKEFRKWAELTWGEGARIYLFAGGAVQAVTDCAAAVTTLGRKEKKKKCTSLLLGVQSRCGV